MKIKYLTQLFVLISLLPGALGAASLATNTISETAPKLASEHFEPILKLTSPDGKITAVAGRLGAGHLAFMALHGTNVVIAPSPLGLLADGHDLGDQVELVAAMTSSLAETYPLPGGHAMATNSYSEAVIPVVHAADQQKYDLALRVFNDGVAIRYLVPFTGVHHIEGESTAWRLSGDAQAWWSPFDASYEGLFRGSLFAAVPEAKTLQTPVTLQLAKIGLLVCVSEADCVNYPDMALRRDGDFLRPHFWASPHGWATTGAVTTPWRVTLIASDLTTLVNSDIFPNLCPPPPPSLAGADWIRPGRVLWQWYSSGSPLFEEQHAWVDAAAALTWEYYLIDDGWRDWKAEGKDQWACLKEVVDYGKTRGVASIVWVNSKEMRDPVSRLAYLKKVKALGAAGIKIDFIPPATAEIMNWYEGTLQDTADLHLMCDFHGCVKPTGRRRTWPQELTREAVRGQEWHITRYKRTMPLETDTIVPFTRFLQGPADYTPMVFDPEQLRGFTWARELASAIVFTSPLMHYGDSYKQYLGNPAEDVLRGLPTTWDETRVLPGTEIGKVTAFARRKGEAWYVGVMNGDQASSLELKLDFLGQGAWQGDLFYDAVKQDNAFDRQKRGLSAGDSLGLRLRPGGGFTARFVPAGQRF